MSEMVERVAKSIDPLVEELCKERGVSIGEIRDIARAAIEEMREPTWAMLKAGQRANNLDERPGHFEFLSHDEMTEAWHAMIDQARK